MKEKTKKGWLKNLALIGVGTLSGFINGFFGAGGGLLLVPMISYVASDDSKKAHATTLGCVLFMCLTSAIVYLTKKEFEIKYLVVCSIGSVVGSLLGTKLLKKLKNNVIDLIFAVILVIAGVFMILF